MRKGERLFQLLTLLRSRRSVITARQLVSERTVYRDIQALCLSNVPIEGEAGVGYRLRPGFEIPPLMFEEDELEALLMGIQMVQGWSDNTLGEAGERAMNKIRSVLPNSLYKKQQKQSQWLVVPDFHREHKSQYSQMLRSAIKQHLQIHIQYEDQSSASSERDVWPLGLVYWGNSWTLVGWCLLRKDYRMFRLDRIQHCTLSETEFEPGPQMSLQHYISLQTPPCDLKEDKQ